MKSCVALLVIALIAMAGAGCMTSVRRANISAIKGWSEEVLDAQFETRAYRWQAGRDESKIVADSNRRADDWLAAKITTPQGILTGGGIILLLGGGGALKLRQMLGHPVATHGAGLKGVEAKEGKTCSTT